jgi:1,4-alpha-glucan branching enzyme
LQSEGFIEIITSAATHAYLPLLSRDSSLHAQMRTGTRSYERLFGRRPSGAWLPECAYRPAYVTEDGQKRAGLESLLAAFGLRFFFAETHTITGGQPVGVAAGEVIGPYSYVKRRYAIPANPMLQTPERPATTYQPYLVGNSGNGREAGLPSNVAVIGRNNETGMQVWSAKNGYPGDFDYREFHKKAGTSGLRYWRVTGVDVDLADKDIYNPEWARYKTDQHAEHFVHLVGDLLRDAQRASGRSGLVASIYDTELFGHWWFEGVDWLGKALRNLAANADLELTTAGRYIERHPPTEALLIPESSWGSSGTHFTWDNGETHWMWEPIHEAEARMERFAVRYADADETQAVVLDQAARELLLLQSSDWPFLVTTGQAREYAIQRFSQHLERFNKLLVGLENGSPNRELAEEYWELDKLFPDIDFRWFAPRKGGTV